jgi:hypothetical protein
MQLLNTMLTNFAAANFAASCASTACARHESHEQREQGAALPHLQLFGNFEARLEHVDDNSVAGGRLRYLANELRGVDVEDAAKALGFSLLPQLLKPLLPVLFEDCFLFVIFEFLGLYIASYDSILEHGHIGIINMLQQLLRLALSRLKCSAALFGHRGLTVVQALCVIPLAVFRCGHTLATGTSSGAVLKCGCRWWHLKASTRCS